MTSGDRSDFSLARLIPSVYAPTLVFDIGIGAILPVIAVTSRELGASLPVAAAVVAMIGVGHIIGDIPAGAFAARVGDRQAMVWSAAATVGALVLCALATTLVLFAAGVLLVGVVSTMFYLARQAYLTDVTPPLRRARALSTLGGVQRIGTFVGPFVGALVIYLTTTTGVYWFAVATSLVAAAVVITVADPAAGHPARAAGVPAVRMGTVLREQRGVFGTLGLAVLAVGAMRGVRVTVLPLWTEYLGFSPTTTSLVFGLSGAIDMLLFYPAGRVMDLRGRLWVAIPSMLTMGLAFVLLPFAGTVVAVSAVACLMGFGNGIGSGIIMTLGADVSPPDRRSQFLGVWRLFADTGSALGPLALAGLTAVGGLAIGIWSMGATSALAAGALGRWVPRWSEHANARTRARAADDPDSAAST